VLIIRIFKYHSSIQSTLVEESAKYGFLGNNDYPSTWNLNAKDDINLFEVSNNTKEYQEVYSYFLSKFGQAQGNPLSSFRVVYVWLKQVNKY
jgi:hypothetical protein